MKTKILLIFILIQSFYLYTQDSNEIYLISGEMLSPDYFINDFWHNPFLNNNPGVDYFGENIELILINEKNEYEIVENRIDNQDWINGFYFKTEISDDTFNSYYLSPHDKSSYRRPYLKINSVDAELKSGIKIGMAKQELFAIIKNIERSNEISNGKILIYLEGIWVYFELVNDFLDSITIEVGD